MLEIFKNKSVYYYLLPIIGLVYLVGFFFRTPNFDEGIIAEWAYWLAKTGTPKSVLFSPLGTGTENVIYVYHKLITWVAAIVIQIFGMKLLPLRILIFLFLLFLLWLIKNYANFNIEESKKNKFFIFATFLLLSFSLVYKFAFTFRPEIMIATLGFASYLLGLKALNGNSIKLAVFSGILAGLSFLTHLNGIAFLLAGAIFLLWNKQYKLWFYYSLAAGIVSLFIFADNISIHALSNFLTALKASPDTTSTEFVWYGSFVKLLNEHKRFFHSPVEISLSILTITSLVFSKKKNRRTFKPLLQYILILIIALGSLTHGKTPKYILLIVPFMVLIITHVFIDIIELKKWKTNTLYVLISLYLIIQSAFIYKQFSSYHNVSKYGHNILELIPKNSTVIGNSNLVFAGIGDYTLFSKLTFEFYAEQNKIEKNLKNFLEFSAERNVDYVSFSKQYTISGYWHELTQINPTFGDTIYEKFQLLSQSDEYYVFKVLQ